MAIGWATGAATMAAAQVPWSIPGERLVQVSGRPEVQLPFLFQRQEHPLASVVLLAGGDGAIQAGPWGSRSPSFLVRFRLRFFQSGFNVAVPDLPSDRISLFGFRTGPEHARDLEALIRYLQAQAPVPVWLVGISQGTLSAANAAARLKGAGPDGLVLASPITSDGGMGGMDTVFDLPLQDVRVPTLLIAHRDDRCSVSPPGKLPALAQALVHAPRVTLREFSGGSPPQGAPCQALAPHGYAGIEDDVLRTMAMWIKAHRPRSPARLRTRP